MQRQAIIMGAINTTIIRFEPLIPIATDEWAVGERIFVGAFQKAMGGKSHTVYHFSAQPQPGDYDDEYEKLAPFQRVVDFPYVTARQARLATSLIRWLGTQIGKRFLEDAFRLRDTLAPRYSAAEAFAMAWTRENLPDNKIRQHLCKETVATQTEYLSGIVNGTCSLGDADTLASTVAWLGSKHGLPLVEAARKRRTRAIGLIHTRQRMRENADRIEKGLTPNPSIKDLLKRPAIIRGDLSPH